jgi:hypothetical protein
MLHDFRQKSLLENWGFECSCSRCRSAEKEVAESDNRRKQIVPLRRKIREARSKREYTKALEHGEELLHIMNVEGLTALEGFSRAMARIYIDLNDFQNAKLYGKMALEDQLVFYGERSEYVEIARTFLKRLETF